MIKKILYTVALLIILSIVVFAVASSTTKNGKIETNKIKITASFYPLAEFAKEVGGDKVEITNITPAGYEPHDYSPTPQDIVKINQSRLFIFNGSNIEPWAKKIVPELKKNGIVVLDMASYVNLIINKNGDTDPHIWLDPTIAEKEVNIIAGALVKIDPANAVEYNNNAKKYIEKLAKLDKEFQVGLASCGKKEAITSHAAFAYLAKRYNIDMISISGISPEEEPSLRRLSEITKLAKKEKIKYIFFETLVSPKLSKMIAKEVGAGTLVLNPIAGLTKKEIKSGDNYILEMKKNLNNLRIAMVCK